MSEREHTNTLFRHSVNVPRFYKVASRTLKLVQEKGQSLKGVIYNTKHPNIKGIYALIVSCIQNGSMLDRLLRESEILMKEQRLDPWLARVLMTELLWGKKRLPPSEAKPLITVSDYEATFVKILREAVKSGTHENDTQWNKVQLKPRYIRVNTLLMSVGDAITAFRHEGWRRGVPATDDYPGFLRKLATLEEDEFLQDFHVKQMFAFPPRTEFFSHELYRNGSLILQDKATSLAPMILNPPPGSAVLDMCAAPGIKTTQLAAIMENKGTLYAVERHPPRYKTLCEFLPRHGVTCATTIQADATTVTPQCQEVEYILVDPTCSGSGMSRPGPTKGGGTDPERLAQLAAFQVILLERALTKFPKVRRVVYSTCSIHPEENEQVVEKVLAIVNADRSTFRLAGNALESWPNRGSTEYEVGPQCLVADPDKDFTTGFFVAVFDRVEESAPDRKKKKKNKAGVEATKQTENKGVERCKTDVERLDEDSSNDKTKKKNKKKKQIDGDDGISGANESFEGKAQGNGISQEPIHSEKVHDDQEVSSNDKQKHKKLKKGKSQTMTEVEETGNDDQSEPGEKRKRKRKKRETDENEKIKENGKDTASEASGEGMKKKKKRSKERTETAEEVKVGTDDDSTTGNSGHERKKRKKERTNSDGRVEQDEFYSDHQETVVEGRKKKKNENESNEGMEVANDKEEANEMGVEHKKRRKHRAVEQNGGGEEVEVNVDGHEDTDVSKKKKKKHKKDKEEAGGV